MLIIVLAFRSFSCGECVAAEKRVARVPAISREPGDPEGPCNQLEETLEKDLHPPHRHAGPLFIHRLALRLNLR